MSKQNKPISWIKIGLTCLGLWIFLKACGGFLGIDDRFSSSEGNAAIQTIGEDMKIPTDTVKNAYYAHYAKGSMPADPNMHYRFEIDRQVLASFIKKNKLKNDKIENGSCIPKSSRRPIGDWWQPSEIQSKDCFAWVEESTVYLMNYRDLDSKTARVYIFGFLA